MAERVLTIALVLVFILAVNRDPRVDAVRLRLRFERRRARHWECRAVLAERELGCAAKAARELFEPSAN